MALKTEAIFYGEHKWMRIENTTGQSDNNNKSAFYRRSTRCKETLNYSEHYIRGMQYFITVQKARTT